MIEYLRFLGLRTARRHLSASLGLPIGLAGILLLLILFAPRDLEAPAEQFVFMCGAALVISVLTSANLTAYLIAEERRGAGSRLLRLAGVDGAVVVVAHLLHAAAVGAVGVAVVTLAPGIYGLSSGMSPVLLLRLGLVTVSCASVGGVLGLWLGYLLPRVVAVLAVQVAGFWASGALASTIMQRPEATRVPLEPLAAVAVAHLLTLALLPSLWRRTSRRLW